MAYGDRYGGDHYGRGREDERGRGQGRDDRSRGSGDDRGFFNRAGDEVRSWFGDEEAERRRREDEQRYEQERRYDEAGGRYAASRGRETQWRGDDSFGGGWGNQEARPGGARGGRSERSGGGRGGDRPESRGYDAGVESGYGRGEGFGPASSDPDSIFTAPGYDPEFDGPRFDRTDVGSTGTHGVHPVASASGESFQGFGMATGTSSSARERAILEQSRRQGGQGRVEAGQRQSQRSRHEHDSHYHEWRSRQIEALDRDYDEYRREHQGKFEQEFGSWRERRGAQRQSLGKVKEHMDVVGSDDEHLGTVDKVRGDRVLLTKSDPEAGGVHHSIPCGWIESVDDKVRINKTAEDARHAWRTEEHSRALFEREDSGSGGPQSLNRSFSGTYRDDR